MSGDSLVQFMDRKEIPKSRRDLKLESVRGYSDANEDFFKVFPDCRDCNHGRFVITIPNTNPVVEPHMEKFPNCNKCNPDIEEDPKTPKFICWEQVI